MLTSNHLNRLNADMIKTTDEQIRNAQEAAEKAATADRKVDDEIKALKKTSLEASDILAGFDATKLGDKTSDAWKLDDFEKRTPAIERKLSEAKDELETIEGTFKTLSLNLSQKKSGYSTNMTEEDIKKEMDRLQK